MSPRPEGPPPPWARGHEERLTPLPGQGPVELVALVIGLLLLGCQLWLLTVALDLFLAGQGRRIGLIALVSGAIAAGGVAMWVLLNRRPKVQRLTTDESGRHVRSFGDYE